MHLDALATAADENLSAAWSSLGRHGERPVAEADGVSMVCTGLPIAFFNGAFLHAPPSDSRAAVAAVVSFFAGREVPYLLWAREPVGSAVLDAGRSAGLRDAGEVPVLGLPGIGDIPPPPAELELELVTTPQALADHHAVMAAGFGTPLAIAQHLVTPSILADPTVAALVGRVAGAPVTTALLAMSGDTAGIYNVATAPTHRGRGYGAAASWAAVAEGARRGCSHAALQASQAGYPIYKRMGFVDLGVYAQLEGPPAR